MTRNALFQRPSFWVSLYKNIWRYVLIVKLLNTLPTADLKKLNLHIMALPFILSIKFSTPLELCIADFDKTNIHSFSHLLFIWEGWGNSNPKGTWNTSWFSANCDSSAGSTLRRNQAVGDVSRHLVLGLPMGRIAVGVFTRTCLADRSWDILVMWSNHCSWDVSIRRSGSTFWVLQISYLRTL